MSDRLIWIAGLGSTAIIIWWWFYMRSQMNRKVNNMTHVLRNDFWRRMPGNDFKYEFDLPDDDIPDEPFPYRAYYSFFAFVDRHFDFKRRARH